MLARGHSGTVLWAGSTGVIEVQAGPRLGQAVGGLQRGAEPKQRPEKHRGCGSHQGSACLPSTCGQMTQRFH